MDMCEEKDIQMVKPEKGCIYRTYENQRITHQKERGEYAELQWKENRQFCSEFEKKRVNSLPAKQKQLVNAAFASINNPNLGGAKLWKEYTTLVLPEGKSILEDIGELELLPVRPK